MKDVKKGAEIYVDYIKNISEKEERSARLTTWFNTPKEYFLQKFYDKMRKYAVKDTESVVTKYNEGLNTLITKSKEQSLNDNDIKLKYVLNELNVYRVLIDISNEDKDLNVIFNWRILSSINDEISQNNN